MVGRIGIVLLLASGFPIAAAAQAKDKPEPPAPCPLTNTLRVADPNSLTGIRSFDDCAGKIVAVPASVDEYAVPQNLRSSPSASAMLATNDGVQTIRIVPKVQESDDYADLGLAPNAPVGASAASILAMRPVSYQTRYDAIIGQTAERYRIDPLLLHAVIDKESRYRVNATSPAGARGLMQLTPATARSLGIAPEAIAQAEVNIDGGARLLRRLHSRYGDFRLTLAAYNAGEGAVKKYGNQVPPYAETQDYVRSVLRRYGQLVAEQPQRAAR